MRSALTPADRAELRRSADRATRCPRASLLLAEVHQVLFDGAPTEQAENELFGFSVALADCLERGIEPCEVSEAHVRERLAAITACEVVQTSAQTFRCETHKRAVEQDDVKAPVVCEKGRG